jgi:hypothetical protein
LDFFERERIDYALIGTFALKAYGYTRATQDVDFKRIRIDRESEANHDLIWLLDKPSVSVYSIYKEISFFEQGWEARFQEAHFFRGV